MSNLPPDIQALVERFFKMAEKNDELISLEFKFKATPAETWEIMKLLDTMREKGT